MENTPTSLSLMISPTKGSCVDANDLALDLRSRLRDLPEASPDVSDPPEASPDVSDPPGVRGSPKISDPPNFPVNTGVLKDNATDSMENDSLENSAAVHLSKEFCHANDTSLDRSASSCESEAGPVYTLYQSTEKLASDHCSPKGALSLTCDKNTDDSTVISEKSNEASSLQLTPSAISTTTLASPKCNCSTIPEISKSLEVEFENESDVVIAIIQMSTDEKMNLKELSPPSLPQSTEEIKDSSKLSIIHSKKILLFSPSKHLHLHKSKFISGKIECTIGTHYKRPSLSCRWKKNDHDYCNSDIECNPKDEKLQLIKSRDCLHHPSVLEYSDSYAPNTTWTVDSHSGYGTVNDYLSIDTSLQLDNSSIWYSNIQANEEISMIKNMGLSQINLERLADAGTISAALFSPGKSRQEERDIRVQERRETFLHTMQNRRARNESGKKEIPNIVNSCLLEKWLKIDTLEVDEINKLLEEITDIVYARRITASQPPGNSLLSLPMKTRRRLLHEFDKVPLPTSSSPVVHSHASMQQKVILKLFAKSLASIKPASESLRGTRVMRSENTHNPPAWELSRSIPTTMCSKLKMQTSNSALMENVVSRVSRDTSQACLAGKMEVARQSDMEHGNSIRSLRSRSIKIAVDNKKCNMRKAVKKSERSSKNGEGLKIGSAISDSEQSLACCEEEWLACSEQWMKHPLDRDSMLQLF